LPVARNLIAELQSLLTVGKLSTEPDDLSLFGKDWSQLAKANPCAIAFPTSTQEVASILRFCLKNDIAVVPSGGRTGLSGGAYAANGELVLSLVKMNRIQPIDTLGLSLRVECGAITEAVHDFCRPHGLTWPVDFASKGSSQIGGNLATNAGGIRVIRYGNTRNWVLGITAVTMQGEIIHCNGALEKNNTGLDLRQLLIGSEGVLAVMTEATLKLTKIPAQTTLSIFSLPNFSAVTKLFLEARSSGLTLSAFEVIDGNCYQSVVENLGAVCPLAKGAAAYCVIEFETDDSSAAELQVQNWIESIFEQNLVQDGVSALTARDKIDFWKIREGVAESIMNGNIIYQQDVSVPVAKLEKFYGEITERYKLAYPEFKVYFFGHFGDGNLHIFIQKPPGMLDDVFKHGCEQSSTDLFEFVRQCEGSISAEHGIGLLKRKAIKYSRSETDICLMNGIKKTFDPKGLLNPGKMLS
jgi:FAD/FMN-containing dehydrogenase